MKSGKQIEDLFVNPKYWKKNQYRLEKKEIWDILILDSVI